MSLLSATEGYVLDDDPARVDLDVVWGFLSVHATWDRWRTREQVAAQVASAWRVVGAYAGDGRMVGFARAISDGVAFGYLADLFVVEGDRGHGLGIRLVREIVDHGPGVSFHWMLRTEGGQGLYADFGFRPADDRRCMERVGRV